MSGLRHRLAVVAVLLVTVLAGCVGGVGDGPGAAPDGGPPYGDVNDLPGVENGTIVDGDALVNESVASLSDEGYVVRHGIEYRLPGEPNRSRERVIRATGDGAWRIRHVAWYHADAAGGEREVYFREDVWSNGTVASYRQWSLEDGVEYIPADVTQSVRESVDDPSGATAEVTFTHERTIERDDGRLFVFTYEETGVLDVDPFRGRIVVDETGTIVSSRLFDDVSTEDGRAVLVFSYELLERGEVGVERPDWLDEARADGAVVPCEQEVSDYECHDP